MRNLISFIVRYFSFILFVILEIVAAMLIVKESSFHHSAYLNSANAVVGNMMKNYNNANSYLHLRQVNDSLAHENAMLREHQLSAYLISTDSSKIILDSLKRPAFKYISAKVISNSTNKLNNYLLLDKGSRSGIKMDWGVICANGVVGVVKDVSEDFCTVISLLHNKSKVSVRVNKSDFVSMTWKGMDATFADIDDIAKHVPIKKGDTVYTSSETWLYPPHLMVGTVDKFELIEGGNFYHVRVKLSNDFSNLNYVYVVNPLLRDKIDSLQAKIKDE